MNQSPSGRGEVPEILSLGNQSEPKPSSPNPHESRQQQKRKNKSEQESLSPSGPILLSSEISRYESALSQHSCDKCAKRKLKCDRQTPRCGSCSKYNWLCSYDRELGVPGPRKGYVRRLEEKVKSLEIESSLLASLLQKSQDELHKADSPKKLQYSGNVTAEESSKVKHPDPIVDTHTTSPTNSMQPELKHIKWFFEFAYPYLPVFHPPSFKESTFERVTSTVYAMSALGLRYHLAQQNDGPKDFTIPNFFYHESRKLVNEQLSDAKLATLQTLVVLEAYAILAFGNKEASIHQVVLTRLVVQMGLNSGSADCLAQTPLEVELGHRVAWYTYIKESFYTVTDQFLPQLMDLTGYVRLPIGEKEWNKDMAVNHIHIAQSVGGASPNSPDSYFQYLSSLSYFMSQIGMLRLNESRSQVFFDSERLQIGQRLEAWFARVPEKIRFPGETFTTQRDRPEPHWDCYFLHLVFHGCQILLHRPKMCASLFHGRQQQRQSCPSTVNCIISSQIISDLSRLSLRQNPVGLALDSFASFCQYQAALVSKDLIRHSEMVASRAHLIDHYRYQLVNLSRSLEIESVYSVYSKSLLKSLQQQQQ